MSDRNFSILQVSTKDQDGGAEKIAWELFQAYRARQMESWLVVGQKRSQDPQVLPMPHALARRGWSRAGWQAHASLQSLDGKIKGILRLAQMARRMAELPAWLDVYQGYEEFRFPGTWKLLELLPQRPDLLHCHNLHGYYFDLNALPWLSQQVPLVLTLHDAWLLSGHCAHSFTCDRWKQGCGQCPDLRIYPAIRRDATAENWQRKQQLYQQSRLYVVTPSRWLMNQVEQSMLASATVKSRVIPNGIDLTCFQPADQARVRSTLGLPLEAKILLCTGNLIQRNPWKDYEMMRQAVAQVATALPDQAVILLALGGQTITDDRLNGAQIRGVPYQKDPRLVAQYYQAADLYLHAAKADTFPTTVLEALACGTPVIATAIGGIPEQVQPGETGFLVPPGAVTEMATQIVQLLQDPERLTGMRQRAIAFARQHFSHTRMVDEYLDWYTEVIADYHRR